MIHCRTRISRIFDYDRVVGVDRWRAIDHRPTGDQLRSEPSALSEFHAPALEIIRVTTHVTHPRYAIREKERERQVSIPNMDVHIPEARNKKLSSSLNDRGSRWRRNAPRDSLDVIAANQNIDISSSGTTRRINDRHSTQEYE
jgi:hypothetical protein